MKHQKSFAFSLFVIAGIVLLAGAPAAFAAGPYTQIGTIAIPNGATQFDILWVDTSSDLMYFSNDHGSKGAGTVDVFDVHNDIYLYSLGLGNFVGLFDATHCCNGPTGVFPISSEREVWAGNGNSTINVIDMDRGDITHIINTGGTARADEMAWDPQHHLLIIGNSSEPTVNFLTVLNTDTHLIQGKINYPNSTGLEQPVWDPTAKKFYVPIDINGGNSEIDEIDPTKIVGTCTSTGTSTTCASGAITQVFAGIAPSGSCPSVSGMALVPYERLVLSCGVILQMPAGTTLATVTQSSGAQISGDEIYFNAGDNQVYWGSAAPWVVDVTTNTLQPTLAPVKAGSHIVAANSNNNHIYVPSSVCNCMEVFAPVADEPTGFTPFVH